MTSLRDLLLDYAEEIRQVVTSDEVKEGDWLDNLTDDYIDEIINRLIK